MSGQKNTNVLRALLESYSLPSWIYDSDEKTIIKNDKADEIEKQGISIKNLMEKNSSKTPGFRFGGKDMHLCKRELNYDTNCILYQIEDNSILVKLQESTSKLEAMLQKPI